MRLVAAAIALMAMTAVADARGGGPLAWPPQPPHRETPTMSFADQRLRSWIADRVRPHCESAASDIETRSWDLSEPGCWVVGETVVEDVTRDGVETVIVVAETGRIYVVTESGAQAADN